MLIKCIGRIFKRKKNNPHRHLKNFYNQWFKTLKHKLLPSLHRSLSRPDSPTVLSAHVDLIHHHFQSLYQELDLAISKEDQNDHHLVVSLLLFPDFHRSPLLKPLLWIGDLHPYVFTNLVRCFLQHDYDDDDDYANGDGDGDGNGYVNGNGKRRASVTNQSHDRPWQVAMAWSNPSEELLERMGEIERGMREMVPVLTARMRNAELLLVDKVMEAWYPSKGKKRKEEKLEVGSVLNEHMEELVSVFLDANRMRSSVLGEIVGKTSVYQAALFLEALAMFLIGFRDQELVSAVELVKASKTCQ